MTATLRELPADQALTGLGGDYFSLVPPTPLPDPKLLAFNPDAAALLGLDPDSGSDPDFLAVMAGNAPAPGGLSHAFVYAGHQFGAYVPQLGDGRALTIQRIRNRAGELWELQLKGAGKTPYSRFGDGRAVLRSTIREYLCSEAMAGLGIPTTRALCIVGSDEPVRRETVETAAVLCRLAPSFIRFGNFEFFYHRGQHDRLRPLADLVMAEHFPAIEAGDYRAWLIEVVERTARLMAQWQAVGFCHGVMNTDNFSILGLTLDYGPFGFLDAFDADFICNHTDEGGRYAYDQQPGIGHWNCSRLLQATLPLLHEDGKEAVKIAYEILERYPAVFLPAAVASWRAKLGLREEREGDPELANRLLQLLDRNAADFTRTFRALSRVRRDGSGADAARDEVLDREAFDAWLADYRTRLAAEAGDDAARAARMDAVNPKYVLRNHLAQRAIEQAQAGDPAEIEVLRRLLARPFDEQPGLEPYAAAPPPGSARVEVSCSS